MPLRPALVLLALAIVGCASAEEAYTDGMASEVAGDYAAAADAYITALERDPDLRNVPGRLRVAGREAVRSALAEADAAASLGDRRAVAEAYLAADDLVARAGAVGVPLDRPATFAEDRDAALAAAVDDALEAAETRRAAGSYESALAATAEARRFRPSPARRADLVAIEADIHGDWAGADLAAGRYHAALAHADAALAASPGDREGPLAALRDRIVDEGRVLAAVLPAEGDDGVDDAFLRDVTDVLVEERLAAPGPFVWLIDPAEVRRWDRQRGRRRGPTLTDSPRRIAEAADDLGADYGVALLVRAIAEQERVGEAETVSARLRDGGGPATYTRREVDLTLSTSADLVVVETATGRTVCDETIRQRAEADYARSTTEGDWRALELPRARRAEFGDDPGAGAYEDALDRLRDGLAAALGEHVAACLDRQVE